MRCVEDLINRYTAEVPFILQGSAGKLSCHTEPQEPPTFFENFLIGGEIHVLDDKVVHLRRNASTSGDSCALSKQVCPSPAREHRTLCAYE